MLAFVHRWNTYYLSGVGDSLEMMLSKEVQAGLDAARSQSLRKPSRLRLEVDGESYPVLRMWKTGCTVATDTPHLRGLADLYDGGAHLSQCLIVADGAEGGEMRYEFKRSTACVTGPALDFVASDRAVAGYITDAR